MHEDACLLASPPQRPLARPRRFNTGKEAAGAAAAGDDDGVWAAMVGNAAHNDHGPRRAGILAGAVRQPPMEWRCLPQRSTRRPREIFA